MQTKHYENSTKNSDQHPIVQFEQAGKNEPLFEEITPQELASLLHTNQNPLQLIDVRESYERAICHLGGLHIPLSNFSINEARQSISSHYPIVVYCKSGIRSANVCQQLKRAGFSNVHNLQGGICRWIKEIDSSLALY